MKTFLFIALLFVVMEMLTGCVETPTMEIGQCFAKYNDIRYKRPVDKIYKITTIDAQSGVICYDVGDMKDGWRYHILSMPCDNIDKRYNGQAWFRLMRDIECPKETDFEYYKNRSK